MIWVHVVYWVVTPGNIVRESGKERKAGSMSKLLLWETGAQSCWEPTERPCRTHSELSHWWFRKLRYAPLCALTSWLEVLIGVLAFRPFQPALHRQGSFLQPETDLRPREGMCCVTAHPSCRWLLGSVEGTRRKEPRACATGTKGKT